MKPVRRDVQQSVKRQIADPELYGTDSLEIAQSGITDKTAVKFTRIEKINDTLTRAIYDIGFYKRNKVVYRHQVRENIRNHWDINRGIGSALPEDQNFISFAQGGGYCGGGYTQITFQLSPQASGI